ncbi:hypothetical protein BKA70DRAFT_1257284 [Coprinopsis sp. MPI-PUGE-AT-0042]|nr:hypothetical protein BKA70DRAFT_1257284 [Coprinopsis sp. MPI-PUGE-AT-0042]
MASQSAPLVSRSPSADARAARAAAAERRLHQPAPSTRVQEELRLKDKKDKFGRLIDPGIIRPNGREQVLVSLAMLLKLAQNLINHPDEAKFKRFKANNVKVKKNLIEPKGVLQYAVEMGFREKVEDYEAYYVYHDRFEEDLRMGAEILEAHIALYEDKKELEALEPVRERVLEEAAQRKVKLQIIEDRIAQKDRSAQTREVSSPEAESSPVERSPSNTVAFSGVGRTLALD